MVDEAKVLIAASALKILPVSDLEEKQHQYNVLAKVSLILSWLVPPNNRAQKAALTFISIG